MYEYSKAEIRQCNYRTNSITLVNGKEIALAVRKREDLRRRMAELVAKDQEGGPSFMRAFRVPFLE